MNEGDTVYLFDPLVGCAHKVAVETLDELYPGWTDPGAYWT